MTIGRLVRMLATLDEPPIDIDEVVSWIKQNRIVNDVDFRFTSKYAKLGGAFEQSPEPESCAIVWVHDGNSKEYSNFVCFKELLHVFDFPEARTESRDAASSLIDGITSISSDAPWERAFQQIGSDYANILFAIVVMVPLHLFARYDTDKYSDEDIARAFLIPVGMVKLLFQQFFKPFAWKILNST